MNGLSINFIYFIYFIFFKIDNAYKYIEKIE